MRKRRNKPKISDIQNQNKAFKSKLEEYSKMTLQELKDLYASRRIGGSYRRALVETVRIKLQEAAVANNQVVNELPETE